MTLLKPARQQAHNVGSVLRVEVAGRLVGEDNLINGAFGFWREYKRGREEIIP